MEHVVTAGRGFTPTRVVLKTAREESKTVARRRTARLEHGADIAFALQIADGGANLMARFQKLKNAMGADEPRPARDQNRTHDDLAMCGANSNIACHPRPSERSEATGRGPRYLSIEDSPESLAKGFPPGSPSLA